MAQFSIDCLARKTITAEIMLELALSQEIHYFLLSLYCYFSELEVHTFEVGQAVLCS